MTGPDASPRTDTEPMAFTGWEFFRGAVTAWWVFLPTLAVLHIWLGAWALIVVLNALTWSFGALVAGAPLAWMLGRMLRRVPRVGIHLLAFAVLGAIVGVATTWVAIATMSGPRTTGVAVLAALHVIAATVAVGIGWWSTARRALREDAATNGDVDSSRMPPRTRRDVPTAASARPAAVHHDTATRRPADGGR